MFAVLKKELKSYLLSPIGYIFIGLFLFMFSFIFYLSVFRSQSVNFEYLFYDGATILTFVIPVLTMRLFSEERKNGTEQLLLTSPKSITSIVLGKFFASVIIVLITEVCTLMYFLILKFFGKPSLVVALSTLGGFLLLSFAYIAFGMFTSTISENQIVSAIITISILLMLLFLPNFNEKLQDFSLIYQFEDFTYGLITVKGVISLVSFTLLFVLLTIIRLKRRKSVK